MEPRQGFSKHLSDTTGWKRRPVVVLFWLSSYVSLCLVMPQVGLQRKEAQHL